MSTIFVMLIWLQSVLPVLTASLNLFRRSSRPSYLPSAMLVVQELKFIFIRMLKRLWDRFSAD
jgi:hypothetical protein